MAATTKVVCPPCEARLKSDRKKRPDKKVRCPRCHATFRIPAPGDPMTAGEALPPSVPDSVQPSTPTDPAPANVKPPRLLGALVGALLRRPTSTGRARRRLAVRAAVWTAVFCVVGLGIGAFLWSKKPTDAAPVTPSSDSPAANDSPLALQVRTIFETNCFRCHGQDDEAEAGVYVLDRDKLVAKKKVVPGDPANSRLYQRLTSATNPMPPEDETPRPSPEDIAQVKAWIAAGAPPVTATATAAGALDAGNLLPTVRDHLLKVPEQDRKFQRYFTLCHLANNPDEAGNLPVFRAALAKLLNSLSWKKGIVQPRAVDAAATVYVLDLRDLDWDTPDRWQEIVRAYPYGLRYDGQANAGLRPLGEEIERLAGVPLPYVRTDWFVATASRPPLYNSLLALPANARQLEQLLGVDLAADFLDGKLRRSGFLKSNVSSQNRLLERHDSRFGAYWKSYDFRSSQNRDSLVSFPLGPTPAFVPNHPFPDLAFEQAGGEIIFNLPNGLQGYMLVDGKDNRIDVAPIEVVRDREETAGTPQVVTGVSCMACHVNGMVTGDNLKDVVRAGSAAEGPARIKVEQLYPPPAEMDQLLQKDGDRYLRALKKTLEPYHLGTADEPISAVARPFLKKGIDLKVAAFELGLADPQVLRQAILTNRTLQKLGLEPLAQGNAIQRASWEQVQGNQSLFQLVAGELGLGSPFR